MADRLWKIFCMDRANREVRNALVEHYLPDVKYHARAIAARLPDSVELDDLVSAGVFGLMDSIDAFDPARGVKFESFCTLRIRGAIFDELRRVDWVPRMVRSRSKQLAAARKKLADRLGRLPTTEELAKVTELSPEEFEKSVRDSNIPDQVSLDRAVCTSGSKDVAVLDLLRDERQEDPGRRLRSEEAKRELLKGLDKRERLIVLLFYYEQMTMKEIGLTLGLSESRVSQIHKRILKRLRKRFEVEAVA